MRLHTLLACTVISLPALAQQPSLEPSPQAPVVGSTTLGPLHVGGEVKAPRLIHQVDPDYSEEARQKKVSGAVSVYLIIDEHGLPQHVRVAKSAGYGLDEEAVKAVKQYRFEPATKDGQPVAVDMYVQVTFHIRAGQF